ncbi:endonuclease V [Maricaulis sp. MIT060901]|uniref:endonuclease V n=1 Tax=Maricaulis sp. MIT060901 TaxID=3096993 RepID=UPI00399A2AA8
MFIALDVAYSQTASGTAAILFKDWADDTASREISELRTGAPEAYKPGEFYKRELPCLLNVIRALPSPPATIIVDGYVWLSADQRPGLGARLFETLGGEIPVVGVSKNAFRGDAFSARVLRGTSKTPLFETAARVEQTDAARRIETMAGEHRIPTLLKRVDRLCRDVMASHEKAR